MSFRDLWLGRSGRRIVAFVTLILLLSACGPRKVIEVPVRTVWLVDVDMGFHAYTTALSPNPVDAIAVTIASTKTLERRVDVRSPELESVHPVVAYDPGRTYVLPEILSRISGARIADLEPGEPVLELGYFKLLVTAHESAFAVMRDSKKSQVDGLSWAVPERDHEAEIREHIERILAFAAGYGADAVVDVALYFQGECEDCRDTGVVLQGRAIARVDEKPEEFPQVALRSELR